MGPAAARAHALGLRGRRPAHALSAAELEALTQAAMKLGRENDPILGAPAPLWWLALGALLVPVLQYAGLWMGLETEGWLAMAMGFTTALALQVLRPLEAPLVIAVVIHWGWNALHLASLAGWIVADIGPLPLPR